METPYHQPDSPAVAATRGVNPSRLARWHIVFVAALAILGVIAWGLTS